MCFVFVGENGGDSNRREVFHEMNNRKERMTFEGNQCFLKVFYGVFCESGGGGKSKVICRGYRFIWKG